MSVIDIKIGSENYKAIPKDEYDRITAKKKVRIKKDKWLGHDISSLTSTTS